MGKNYSNFIIKTSLMVILLGIVVEAYAMTLKHNPDLADILGQLPMATDTAFCFILSGTALLLHFKGMSGYRVSVRKLLAAITFTCSVFAFLQTIFYNSVGKIIKHFLQLGMSPQTSFCFFCIGIIMFNIGTTNNRHIRIIQYILQLVAILSFIVILGYMFNVNEFYTMTFIMPMAIYTAIGLLLFTIATSLINPTVGITGMFTGNMIGHIMGRRIFFQMLMPVLIMGYLHILDHRYNWFGDEFGSALQTVVLIFIGIIVIWETANSLNILERKKNIAQENFRIAVESAPYALAISDRSGKIIIVNHHAQKLYGYNRDELIGQSVKMLIPKILHTDYQLRRDDFFEKGMVIKMVGDEDAEILALRKDGTAFPIEIILTPIRTDNDSICLASIIDISPRVIKETIIKNQLTELHSKNQELEQFNYISSHDLQEPLRTVLNYIDLLQEDYPELDKEVKSHLEAMKASITRMSTVVRSLLDFGRLGRNKIMGLTNINAVINEVKADLYNLIKSADAEIIIEDQLPVLLAYETELRQLFQNLVSNAVKFRKSGIKPIILIGCSEHNEFYKLHVADNGIGIEPKYFEKVFHIFQRLNKEEEYEGNGIGLANCKKIAEMHGGKIWVESEPGKGSKFIFTILKFKP